MELLFRFYGVLHIIIRTLLEPIYWIISKLDNPVPLQPIIKPVLCMSATQMAAKIRSGEVCIASAHVLNINLSFEKLPRCISLTPFATMSLTRNP